MRLPGKICRTGSSRFRLAPHYAGLPAPNCGPKLWIDSPKPTTPLQQKSRARERDNCTADCLALTPSRIQGPSSSPSSGNASISTPTQVRSRCVVPSDHRLSARSNIIGTRHEPWVAKQKKKDIDSKTWLTIHTEVSAHPTLLQVFPQSRSIADQTKHQQATHMVLLPPSMAFLEQAVRLAWPRRPA